MKHLQSFLFLLAGICLLQSCETAEKIPFTNDGTEKWYNEAQKPFYHGVASGDPLVDGVILWTRVTPEFKGTIKVDYLMAEDEDFSTLIGRGSTETDSSSDYTVKIDVRGLDPGKTYYYKFKALGADSPVGKTKTLAKEGTAPVKLAVVSCSNFEFGYFNALGRIADHDDLDAVLHLGDYIYEYSTGYYGDTTIGRKVLPQNEIVSLQDYRTRYSTYRLDPDFQKAHQKYAFVTVWDDHEITNDSHTTGAENHQPEKEGDYTIRKEIARKVYFEWMPVRDNGNQEIFRKLQFGNLVDVIMLDGRLAGRTPQADSLGDPTYGSDEQSMLGAEQLAWLKSQLEESKATWKVLGNQVIFSELDISPVFPDAPRNLDAWDGYPKERNDLIQYFETDSIENVVILTGDTHCSWAFEVPRSRDDYAKTQEAVAVEFATTSITSANYDEYTSLDTTRIAEAGLQYFNPQLKYVNLSDHGYMLLTLSDSEAQADWYFVETIREPNAKERLGKTIKVQSGSTQLELE